MVFSSSSSSFEIEGYTQRADEMINIEYEVVAARYFQTMRIPLIEGREFSETDQAQSSPEVIINENMARRYWAGRNAVGGRVRDGPEIGVRSSAWRAT